MRHRMSREDRKYNVRNWISNDYDLYQFACWCIESTDTYPDATREFLRAYGQDRTPDGITYTYEAVIPALIDVGQAQVA